MSLTRRLAGFHTPTAPWEVVLQKMKVFDKEVVVWHDAAVRTACRLSRCVFLCRGRRRFWRSLPRWCSVASLVCGNWAKTA